MSNIVEGDVAIGIERARNLRQLPNGLNMNNRFLALSLGILLAGQPPGCSNNVDELTLVTYSSFPAANTDLNDALSEFTEDTGITVSILNAGDTGTMVTKAVSQAVTLKATSCGVLQRAGRATADIFEPYVADAASTFDAQLVGLGNGIVTPVDFEMCVNYDRSWFADNGLEPPPRSTNLPTRPIRVCSQYNTLAPHH